MEDLNLGDSTTSVTPNVPLQDVSLEGDSVGQPHVHEIQKKTDTISSEHSFYNPEERENKRTRPWRGTRSNYNNHNFPMTYQRDSNTEGYYRQTQHGYNGRGHFPSSYPNIISTTYHRDNIRTSAQPYGYHGHRYHDWNAHSTEQHYSTHYMDGQKNLTNWETRRPSYDRQQQPLSNDRQRQPRTNDRQQPPWNDDRQQQPRTNDRQRQPWNDDRQQQPWTNDRQRQPWNNDKQQPPWTNEQRRPLYNDRQQQPWRNTLQQQPWNDRQRQPWNNDRHRQPWNNDRQRQPWNNNAENLSHRGSPYGYRERESYILQNGARPYRFHEREESSQGLQNGVRQHRFHVREQPRIYYSKDEVASNLDAADSVNNTNIYDSGSEEFEPKTEQEIEGCSVHEQTPILRELNSCLRKKLIILDVNGLLADVIFPPPKEDKADINIYRRAIFKRPFVNDFLKFCFERFDVAIWSSRTKKILDGVVGYLLGDMRCKLLFCWDQSHCTKTGFKTLENNHKELLLKEIKKVWEKHEADLPYEKGYYDESNTLLLDDSPYKALLNPMHTAIFPHTYSYKDTSDNSLGADGDLRVYLTGLLNSENFKRYVEEHPFGQKPIDETSSSWDYYLNIISSQARVQPQT